MGLGVLKIRCNDIVFESKLENLCGKADPREVMFEGEAKLLDMKDDGSPTIVRTDEDGEPLHFTRLDKDTGDIVRNCANVYMNKAGEIVEDMSHYYLTVDGDLIPAIKNVISVDFTIGSFMHEEEYITDYLVDKYYQIMPYQGKSKNDINRKTTRSSNVVEMKKLWDLLIHTHTVGKGMVCLSSAGWLPNVGFIRAIRRGQCWTLELGIAKQKKQYTWVEEHDFKLSTEEQAPVIQHQEL